MAHGDILSQPDRGLGLDRPQTEALLALFSRCDDLREFGREVIQSVVNALMDSQAQEACGAPRGSRSPGRVNSRNGYRERSLSTSFGDLELRVPKLRDGLATLMWTVPGGALETGGPYMRDPRHPRHFTDEFKRQIVDLYNAGKPKREIMDEYDLGKSTVERWIKSINATGSPRAADNRTPEQNRILELERENRRLRMEVDVLKQAALIYARK